MEVVGESAIDTVDAGGSLREGGPAGGDGGREAEAGVTASGRRGKGGTWTQTGHRVPAAFGGQVEELGIDEGVGLGRAEEPEFVGAGEALIVDVQVAEAGFEPAAIGEIEAAAVARGQRGFGVEPEQVLVAVQASGTTVDLHLGHLQTGVQGEEQRVEGCGMRIVGGQMGVDVQLLCGTADRQAAGGDPGSGQGSGSAADGAQLVAIGLPFLLAVDVGRADPGGTAAAAEEEEEDGDQRRAGLAQTGCQQRGKTDAGQAEEDVGGAEPEELVEIA